MKSFRWISLVLLMFAVAGFALAQNADQNTAAPTKNDYKLRVVQPMEGATITGHNVQVVVDTEIPAERDVRHDIHSMPHPFVDVFVDDVLKGTMKGDENVVNVANVAPGSHTIVLLAKNVSGEVIDRKVINVVTVLPPAAKPVVGQPVAPPPAPAYVPPPAPAHQPPPAPVEEKLPRTGTSDPLLAVAGLVLLAGGFAVRRLV